MCVCVCVCVCVCNMTTIMNINMSNKYNSFYQYVTHHVIDNDIDEIRRVSKILGDPYQAEFSKEMFAFPFSLAKHLFLFLVLYIVH